MKTAFRITLLSLVSTACLLAGDLTITFKATGKGSGAGSQTHYYSTSFHKTADEITKTDTLVDYGKGTFYTIKHKDKKIEMITFDDLVAVGEAMNAKLAQMPAFLQGMMGGGDPGEIKVVEVGPETVAGRSCKKFKLTIGKILEELSMDPTLKPPVNPAAFAKFAKIRTNMLQGPMSGAMKKITEETSKLQGIALKTHMTGFMGADTTLEATEVNTSAIPGSVFALPDVYKTEDTGKKLLKDLQKN